MPAIAAAALAMIRAETRLTPEMSTTEYIIVTSTAPTYGRVSPEASVETISFGTPTGSARIARVAIDEPPEPPSARIAVEPPSACRPRTTASAPAAIASTAAPRSPRARELGDVGSARARDLASRDVGREADRLVDAGVDDQHLDAVLEQPVAQEGVLDALRVERPERGRPSPSYAHARSASGSTPR